MNLQIALFVFLRDSPWTLSFDWVSGSVSGLEGRAVPMVCEVGAFSVEDEEVWSVMRSEEYLYYQYM